MKYYKKNKKRSGKKYRRYGKYKKAKLANRIYSFCRTTFVNTINQSAATDIKGQLSFMLSNLDDYNDFTQLFDQYRINKVVCRFIPKYTVSNLNTGAATNVTRFFSCIDTNDNSIPSNLNEIRQYQTCKITNATKSHTRTVACKPIIGAFTYAGSFVAPMTIPKGWINCASATVEHFGLKYGIDQGVTGTLQSWGVEIKYYLSFRTVR